MAASPLNPLKLDLAVLLLLLPCLWLALELAGVAAGTVVGTLAGSSTAGALWLVWRTRALIRRERERQRGAQQE